MYTHCRIILFVSVCLLLISGCNNIDSKLLPIDQNQAFKILIRKNAHSLELYSGTICVKTYQCSLGRNPDGAKEVEGDNKTPVGNFSITTKNAKSRFHRFLGISYPAIKDAERGLRQKRITSAEYDAIVTATQNKRQPPQTTRLGGNTGIHGNGYGDFFLRILPWRFDWTRGCIALTNQDIEELFNLADLGTPVEIIE